MTAEALGEVGTLDISISPDSFVISQLEVDGSAITNDEVPITGGQLTLTWLQDGAATLALKYCFLQLEVRPYRYCVAMALRLALSPIIMVSYASVLALKMRAIPF